MIKLYISIRIAREGIVEKKFGFNSQIYIYIYRYISAIYPVYSIPATSKKIGFEMRKESRIPIKLSAIP